MLKNRYFQAFISASLSIVPMVLIILILSWTNVFSFNAGRGDYLLLFIGMFILIAGLSLFSVGASMSLTKVGEYMGSSLSKQKSLFIVILFSFALGALITVAEPSIMIVSKQVPSINPVLLIGGIAIGVGLFVVVGVLRIIFHRSIKLWYLLFYAITFMLLILVVMNPEKAAFIPFIFDSGGVTTGSATVPFILSLGAGIAVVRGGKNAKNNSFGLVGMASIGPIITVTILILISNLTTGAIPSYSQIEELTLSSASMAFLTSLLPINGSLGTMIEVIIALAPTLVIFLIYNALFIKLPKSRIQKLLFGFLLAFVGLSLFLCGTSAAMTPIGNYVGRNLGNGSQWLIILIAFIIGLVTILCEPAVHVLTTQMEQVSDGHIKKITVLLSLSIGVGVAIGLAALRTLFNFSIMYYMVPGYLLSLILMFVCPDIYTAMAFDSGGTASGPMASSFVLPMIAGITIVNYGDNSSAFYENAFGVIALIALTPVIAIQLLGVVQNLKQARARFIMRKNVYSIDDAQIIHFN